MKENFNVFHGDNIEILKTLPDNSIDSVVTDPPYGLGKEPNAEELMKDWIEKGYHEITGKGFMGKEWDAFVPQPIFWKEVFRVLKPGGYVVSFFGTRTYDWGVMAMRFAGFEIRDLLQYLYGCLSSDTEILTEKGWVSYDQYRISNKYSIFVYNPKTDEYYFEQPEKWNEYQIKDTCYRIQSDYTDQIVSRNHRCLVEREGKLLFEFAETIAQEHKANIPFLEKLPNMSEDISNIHKGTSCSQQSMWEELSLSNNFNKKERSTEKTNRKISNNTIKLFGLWKKLSEKQLLAKKSKKSNLFKKMQWVLSWSRMEKTRTQGKKSVVRRNEREISTISNGAKQSILERWNNLSQKERVLFGGKIKICEMPERVYINGKERWLYSGVQVNNGKTIRQSIIENRVRSSHRPQSNEQRYNEFDAVCKQQGTQAVRMGRSYSTTLATITPIEYTGVIFCPTVSTGCFVARRNGKTFITGNSGFPKSHNISKAIDKMYGAEREVIGKRKGVGSNNTNSMKNGLGVTQEFSKEFNITKPATNQSKQWDGWGSALKPAVEPIVLARKPLEKGLSIAENVLKWGTGGINIDGCRVGSQVRTMPIFSNDTKGDNTTFNLNSNIQHHREETSQGRFPANIILQHHPECKCVGTKKVGNGERKNHNDGEVSSANEGYTRPNKSSFTHKDSSVIANYGEETIEDWICHENCPIKILDEQSGESKSSDARRSRNTIGSFGMPNDNTPEYSDKGGASRFFYCAKTSKTERNKGLDGFEEKIIGTLNSNSSDLENYGGMSLGGASLKGEHKNPIPKANIHPTVKPIDLCRYLTRLITPPNGIVLDPFLGSGTTGCSVALEGGFGFIGIEREKDYVEIAKARIEYWSKTDIEKKEYEREIEKRQETENNTEKQLDLFE
jgi:site-specific DNA-methyltransferase (adenine-specific)